MPSLNVLKPPKWVVLLFVSMALIGGSAAAIYKTLFGDFWDSPQSQSVEKLNMPPIQPAKPAPAPADPAPLAQKMVEPSPAGNISSLEPPSGINTRKLTETLASLELRRAELALKEVEQKISALDTPHVSPVSPGKSQARPQPSSIYYTPQLISISGLDGDLSATVSSGAGRRNVRKGDNVDSYKVEQITAVQVTLRGADGRTHMLRLED
ncbi:MAG: type IV pilus biogenesis protein PilP [Deltaproteobacteria bacterium]|jgi:type IV pilus biogenesis protein PilP|nr:type IV pilus biogenesis protein PilP [Deltaproteobacteria bacterium]